MDRPGISGKQALRPSPGELRALQIVQVALMGGVLLFGLVVVLIAMRPPAAGAAPIAQRVLVLLSAVHAVIALIVWSLAPLLQGLLVARLGAQLGTAGGVGALRGALIVRLALLEGPALFGLVICLIAATGGALRATPLYWLNALSAVAFVGYGVLSFPTAERLEALADR
ncbi:hypothetical protein FJ251_07705 [bacterium]|nr:hypothetical protein [bacterium]